MVYICSVEFHRVFFCFCSASDPEPTKTAKKNRFTPDPTGGPPAPAPIQKPKQIREKVNKVPARTKSAASGTGEFL